MQNLHDQQGVKKLSLSLKTVDTDWINSGPTVITSTGAIPTKGSVVRDRMWWRRRGDSMEVRVEYEQSTGGTAGNGAYLLQIPVGYTIDLQKIASSTSIQTAISCIGTFTGVDNSGRAHGNVQVYDSTRVIAAHLGYDGGTNIDQSAWGNSGGSTVDITFNQSAMRFAMHFTVPILGWSTHDANPIITGTVANKQDMELQTPGKTVPPSLVKFNPGVAKAWVNFNGQGVIAIRDSFNVTSITDNGVSSYTVNFTQPFANTNYAVVITVTSDGFVTTSYLASMTVNSVSFSMAAWNGNQWFAADKSIISVVAYGKQ